MIEGITITILKYKFYFIPLHWNQDNCAPNFLRRRSLVITSLYKIYNLIRQEIKRPYNALERLKLG